MTDMGAFQQDLEVSKSPDVARKWDRFYQAVFGPDYIGLSAAPTELDWTSGIDRYVHLTGGRLVAVQEKYSPTHIMRDRVLIEVWAHKGKGVPGWIEADHDCDYIAWLYGGGEVLEGCILPWKPLKAVWDACKQTWLEDVEKDGVCPTDSGRIEARTSPVGDGYCLLVPKGHLLGLINRYETYVRGRWTHIRVLGVVN